MGPLAWIRVLLPGVWEKCPGCLDDECIRVCARLHCVWFCVVNGNNNRTDTEVVHAIVQ